MKVTLEKIEKIIVPECDGAYIKRRRINDEREFTLVFPKPKKAHLNKEREQHIFTIATNFLGEQIVHTFDETICSKLDEKEKKTIVGGRTPLGNTLSDMLYRFCAAEYG